MTATDSTTPGGTGRRAGRRGWVPFAAAATAAALTAAAIATAGGGSAGAAEAPNAQSAGNFLDATIGGNPIDSIAKLAFARAQNPGSVTDQNPLDVTLLNAINLPLTGALQLPKLAGINLGAVNQVALAKSDGESYGAAGAVLNSGGVSVGGDNNAPPAGASIDLCASALNGGQCGSGPADALGEIKLGINGVSSIARTPDFGPPLGSGWPSVCTQASATCYDIAGIDLTLDSPALGQLLSGLLTTITTTLNTVVTGLANGIGNILDPASLTTCALTAPDVITKPISIDNGAVVLDPTNAALEFHLEKLLQTLGLDLNALPANTDLVTKLLNYITSVNGLAKGLEGVINGVTDILVAQFKGCEDAIKAIPLLGPVLTTLINTLINGQTTLETAINGLLDKLATAAGPNPLLPLANALKPLLDIGINVQPQVSSGDFQSAFDTNPKQGMDPPPVPYEHTVRAIEVKLLGDSGVNLALANSAAGPSNPATPPTTPPTTAPPTAVPTGVPAGQALTGGSPLLPAILLSLGLIFAAGGVVSYRMRGALNKH